MSISQILNNRGYSDMATPEQPTFPAVSPQQQQQQQQTAPPPTTATRSPAPPKQIHRNRAQHICHACRRRKVKCDRQHPVCGGCAKMGVPCEWSDNSQIGKDGDKKQLSSSTQQSPPNGASKIQIYNGTGMPPPAFSPSQKRGHKRQRTHPDASISEESDSFSDDQRFDIARHAFGRDQLPFLPGGLPRGASSVYSGSGTGGTEEQLENRLSRLAEIVDRWCRDTYLVNGAPTPGGLNHESLRKDLQDLQAFTRRRGSTSQEPTAASPSIPPPWNEYHPYGQGGIQLPGGLRSPSTSVMDTSESVTNAEDVPMSPFTDPPAPKEHVDNSLDVPGAEKIPDNWRTYRAKGMEEITSMFDQPQPEERGLDDQIDPRIREPPTTPKARRNRKGQQEQAAASKVTRPEDDDLSLGHLSIQEDGRTRYVGSTFWAFISNEISELNQVLQSQTDNPADSKNIQNPSTLPQTFNLMEDEKKCGPIDASHLDVTQKSCQPTAFTPPYSECSGKPSPGEASAPTRSEVTRIMAALDENDEDHSAPINPKRDMHRFRILPENSSMCAAAKLQAGFAPEHQARQMVWFLKYLPLEHQSHALYKAFLSGVHPVVPLLHSPSFNRDYMSFWKIKNEESIENLHFSPTFVPLLFAVLYTGSLSISSRKFNEAFPDKGHTRNVITDHLHKAALATLAVTAFPRGPTLSSLIAYLLVHTCKIREEEPLTSYAFVGVAMRAAQSAGLHREPSSFRGLNEVEREVRRRIWWHIIYLDVQAAIATGLPPLGGSDESAFDTQMVSELKDEYIGCPNPVTADDIKKDEAAVMKNCTGLPDCFLNTRSSTAMIAAVGRYEATRVLRKLVLSLFSVRVPQKQDVGEMGKIICDLQEKIDERINRIPARGIPEMGFVPPGGSDEENSTEAEKLENFNGWARTMLSLMYDKCFSVLYQPFLRTIQSRQWQYARQCSLHACHRLLRKFLFLSTSPAFRPYFWFLPGTYQPLHSCMILLLDLYNRPVSDEIRPSRMLLDQVFNLFGPDGNGNPSGPPGAYDALAQRPLVEGGKEAWAMMARLRVRAYARMAGGARIPQAPRENQISKPAEPAASKKDTPQVGPKGERGPRGLTAKEVDEMIERSIIRPGGSNHNSTDAQQIIAALTPAESGSSSGPSISESPAPPLPQSNTAGESRSQMLDYSIVDDLPVFSELNTAGYNMSEQGYESQDFGASGIPAFPSGNFGSYENGYSIGGIALDAAGFPVIMAPGVMYNMETGQAQVQYEDHGGNMDSQSSGSGNNDIFMDMSRDNIDWNAWDKTFGTYASVSQNSDPGTMHAIEASFRMDDFSRENNFI
ncbi:hypothetical protein ABW19_dt0209432 [Dactylella cylindrospora]|nr:hypothetical protein ABW19_dt0209432 [Dactylella cylindrospora]